MKLVKKQWKHIKMRMPNRISEQLSLFTILAAVITVRLAASSTYSAASSTYLVTGKSIKDTL